MPYDAGAFCTRAKGDICLDAKRWRRLLMNNGYDRWRILTPFIVYSPEELHMWLLTGLHYWCVGVVTGVVEGAKILANALVLLLELVAVMVVMAEAFRRRRRSRTTSQFLNQPISELGCTLARCSTVKFLRRWVILVWLQTRTKERTQICFGNGCNVLTL